MPATPRLTSAYANAPYISENTPEFRFKSVRALRCFAGKRSFKSRLMQQLPAWRPLYEGRPTLIFTFLLGIWMRMEILRLLIAERGLNCTLPYPATDTPHKDDAFVHVCEIHIHEDIKGPVMFGYRWNQVVQSHSKFGEHLHEGPNLRSERQQQIRQLQDEDNMRNNGQMNTDYLVWQNKAAFPVFRKPYRSLNRNNDIYKDGLPKGIYKLKAKILTTLVNKEGHKYIQKEFRITTSSWLGIRNVCFAWAYIVVGIVCTALVLAVGLVLIHLKYGKSLKQKCSDSMPVVFH